MITEGGYEYDRSGVYYGLPGPWATGTEDLLIQSCPRIIELTRSIQAAFGRRIVEVVSLERWLRD